jgi:hypothetical protein
MKTSTFIAAAAIAASAGIAFAQTAPQANVTPNMPAGQQSSQGTPMGETGTTKPVTGALGTRATVSAPMPVETTVAAAPRRVRADRN